MLAQSDVAIVGGGPAGTAAAIALAQAGRSVVVLERSDYDCLRIGETLPPIAQLPLARLGAWERFVRGEHLPSPGTLSVWGQSVPDEAQFILSPYGDGWHLDRRRFDGMLADVAQAVGAQIQRGARVTACLPIRPSGWQIEYVTDGRRKLLRTRFLVDASGRAPSPARLPGTRRISYDRLVGISALFSARTHGRKRDVRTLVEAVHDGWWYSAWLPSAQLVVCYMTDADLKPKGQERLSEHWHNRLAHAPHTRARLKGCALSTGMSIVAANTSRLSRVTGAHWLAVGDAATTYDPLSSLGIYTALASGWEAAQTIARCEGNDLTALARYELWTQENFAEYLKMRAIHYGRELRWPASKFWQRRQPALQTACEPA